MRPNLCLDRVTTSGKFLRLCGAKFYVKGFSYGPFAPNSDGEPLPDLEQVRADFVHMSELGANTVRVYFPPPKWLLDEALDRGLYVLVDIPWDKHRCFFEDWNSLEIARGRVRKTAREVGNHPAVLAISVVNEIPADIVRFYGAPRVVRFIEELLTIAKEEAPNCLVTFNNFPTTEFLEVGGCDFVCFNVYLHAEEQFASYLDRLQHIAGNKPLVMGEFGIDSLREGDVEQAALLTSHLNQAFRHGLAGSIIFAYTDDWFTGGHQISDWYFGVTCADRSEKLSAKALRSLWHKLPESTFGDHDMPKASIVVCSFNGGKTLRNCLQSLMNVDYPNYEVILVDDGSTDSTARVAADFPDVKYYYQENQGLSVARNTGARLSTGDIIAYTDDDCEVDEDWLSYLVLAMADQNVEAIGGPNIPPPSDSWIAKCVAVSPGAPSHVMLDDRSAEHVPGCNLCFDRSALIAIGGFDPQFLQAGDDVDICWRFIDAGKQIGYAPGAMVWHHRRSSVSTYIKQQRGYGRSEAMVYFKHFRRFDSLGRSKWNGVIYGDGAVGLNVLPPLIYQGRLGSAPFQCIYRNNRYHALSAVTTIEWHFVAIFVLSLSILISFFLWVSLAMWLATALVAFRSARYAPLEKQAPAWCRPLVWWLNLIQPIVRGWTRYSYVLRFCRLPRSVGKHVRFPNKKISSNQRDMYWDDDTARGRELLLDTMLEEARNSGWFADFDDYWSSADVKLMGDGWHRIEIRTATEELSWPRRFTRARISIHASYFAYAVLTGASIWCTAAILSMQIWTMSVAIALLASLATYLVFSRRRCLDAATELVARSSVKAGLKLVQTHDTKFTKSEVPIVADKYAEPIDAS